MRNEPNAGPGKGRPTMNEILIIGLCIIVAPILIPVVCYYGMRAAREGWLHAEQRFFADPKTYDEKEKKDDK